MTTTPEISDERKKDIAGEFRRLVEAGNSPDDVAEAVSTKYGLTKEDVHQIVQEQKQDPDPQPGD